ncbi:MFS transporter [Nakamurella leprariae]|uniref:MFS transporter n=1 Tax=Nakamurella leprariae TaxID=2803911 RepID=A0A939BXS1_9ACTN|nr:MFS transporter [Nakamurella leprariae]MBM9465881.1 MFS transporter [Nakamurella leprariae]
MTPPAQPAAPRPSEPSRDPVAGPGDAGGTRWWSRPPVILSIAAGVYFFAVFHRTSLGVAGPQATERLSLSATQLSSFIVLQLAVYATMQIPTGLLVDRFGPRRMLLAATLVMGTAQVTFSLVDDYAPALLARGLLGVGDAMTYVSVLRLAAAWFSPRRYPIIASLAGVVGMAGNLMATVPLTALLADVGWTTTFAVAGGLSLVYALVLVRPAGRAPFAEPPAPPGPADPARPSVVRRVRQDVADAWRVPGDRLGFWVHLTCMTGPVTFSVLWGFPYLTQGLGLAATTASTLLLVFVVGGVVGGLVIAPVVARRPVIRAPLAMAVCIGGLLGWVVLLGWPGGTPPMAVLLPVIAIWSVGGPASSVAFLLARDYNPRRRISTATGMVNVGGFLGTVVSILLVGFLLDLVDPASATASGAAATHSLTAFRIAFLAPVLVTVFGLGRMTVWFRRTRATVLLADARGEQVPVHLVVHRWELVDTDDLRREASLRQTIPPPPGVRAARAWVPTARAAVALASVGSAAGPARSGAEGPGR